MTDATPVGVLAAAREAVRMASEVEAATVDGFVRGATAVMTRAALAAHARTHYGAIAAALLAAQEREAGRLWVVVDAGCWACEGDGPEIVGVFTDQAVAEGHAERLFQAQDELGLHRHRFFACEAPRLNHIQPWRDTPENAEGTPDA